MPQSIFTNKVRPMYIWTVMFKSLDRYIIKELTVPFLIGIFILTFLILIQQLLRLMELIVGKGVDLLSVGQIFITLLPSFFLLSIPMAVMLASVVTFDRLSSDNEIIALKSVGIGFFRLIQPVLIFSILASLLTLSMGMLAQPPGKGSFKTLAVKILKKRINVGLEEGRFNETFSRMMIYVESMPTFSELQGVFIIDRRNPEIPVMIVAKRGTLTTETNNGIFGFNLYNGSLHRRGRDSLGYQRMTFERYDLRVDLSSVAGRQDAMTKKTSYSEIKKQIEASKGKDIKSLQLLSAFYKHFALSLAALVFGIIGVPLGIIAGRLTRVGGFTVGIAIIGLYYLLTTFGDYLISIRLAPPIIGASFPHFFLIPFCIYLLNITANESFPNFLQFSNKRP
ncbi:MAG: LptF/LptG family permease [Nitrospiria bacterium]